MPSPNIVQVQFESIEFHPEIKNCRESVGDVSELIDSIQASGLLQPLVVLEKPEKADPTKKRYFLVAGFRRHEAIRRIREGEKAAFKDVDVRKFEGTFADAQALNLIENIQRDSLSAAEIGSGVERLLNLGFRQSDIAKKIGKGLSWVSSALAFHKSAIPSVRAAVQEGQISYVVAQQIASLDEKQQEVQVRELVKHRPKDATTPVIPPISIRTAIRESSDRAIKPTTAEVRNEVLRLEQEKTMSEFDHGVLIALKWSLGDRKTLRREPG